VRSRSSGSPTSTASSAAKRHRPATSRRTHSTCSAYQKDFGALLLLRQYLKLGGRLACFNVDESFSGVLDGLIVVDLMRTEPKVLQKYMGREQAAAFMAYATRTTTPSICPPLPSHASSPPASGRT
jgi:hypothetical protein